MCLLLTKPASFDFSEEDSVDFFSYNADGVGVMYHDGSTIVVEKLLPKSAAEAHQFLTQHTSGREAVVHWRMRTHGDIDLENCHPYPVGNTGFWLAHNGVLSHSNANDRTKSDTWHFIKDVLLPIVSAAGDYAADVIHNPAFGQLLGQSIGNNRFAIMSPDGRVAVINRGQGKSPSIYPGCWLSNTYAWTADRSPELARPMLSYPSTGHNWSGGYGKSKSHSFWSDADDFGSIRKPVSSGHAWPDEVDDDEVEEVGVEVAYYGDDDEYDLPDEVGNSFGALLLEELAVMVAERDFSKIQFLPEAHLFALGSLSFVQHDAALKKVPNGKFLMEAFKTRGSPLWDKILLQSQKALEQAFETKAPTNLQVLLTVPAEMIEQDTLEVSDLQGNPAHLPRGNDFYYYA